MADEQDSGGRERRIELTVGGVRLSIPVDVPLPPSPPPAAPPESPPMWYSDWLVWSDVERDVLLALLDGPRSKRQLAAALQASAEGHLGDILSNLAAKRILLSGQDGYTLNLPADRREAFRAHLLANPPTPPPTPG
jgi:hypothetical protein